MDKGSDCTPSMVQTNSTDPIELWWTVTSGASSQRRWGSNTVQKTRCYWIDTGVTFAELNSVAVWIDFTAAIPKKSIKPIFGVILNSDADVNDGVTSGTGSWATLTVKDMNDNWEGELWVNSVAASNTIGDSQRGTKDDFIKGEFVVCPSPNPTGPDKVGWRTLNARWLDSAANNYESTNANVFNDIQSEWYWNSPTDTLKIGILQGCGAATIAQDANTTIKMKAKVYYLISKSTTGWKP